MFLTINGGRLWRQRFCRRERSLSKCTREVTMVLPSTNDRVPRHTSDEINDRIHQDIAQRLHRINGTPGTFAGRLRELDEEWDIERAIELNASVLALAGVVLGFFVHPYWLVLPGLVTAFLLQHALQGWCPPVPVLRRWGFRTADEIGKERMALKALRGDFGCVLSSNNRISAALRAAEAR